DKSGVLPGVSIVIEGSNRGVETNFDGKYSIEANSGDVFVFRYLGYETAKITVATSNIINITLVEGGEVLDEIVITALGIKRSEKALGYSTQQVSSEELTTVRDANIVNSLSGKIAGVSVTNTSGAVGASSRIVIRGISSISGNAQPLVVVDGVVMDNTAYGDSSNSGGNSTPNGLADLNQDDIESLNVLKGGAATSLYGMRGSNGVIVVTTKSGKNSNKLGIEISSSVSFENVYVLPDYQNSYGQGSSSQNFEYIDGITGDGGVDESWGPALDSGLEFVQWNSVNGEALPWVSQPNNIKDFFETGMTTNNNIAFSNGNDDYNGRISAGITDQKGILYNTDLTKYNIGGKINLNLSEKWSVGMTTNYIKTESGNLPSVGYGDSNNQLGQIVWSGRNVDWNALRDYNNLPTAFAAGADVATPINWNGAYNNNPYWVLDTNTNTFDRNRLLGNMSINYQMSDKLSFSAQTGIDYFSSLDTNTRAFGTYQSVRGSYKEVQRTRYEINSQAILSYNTDIGQDFKLNANIGGNSMVNNYHRLSLEAPELQIPNLYNISNTRDGVTPSLGQSQTDRKINSVFGFMGVSYKDYLFLDVTGRNDWASVLPIKNNSFFYPSATASAIISDIFELPKSTISYLKMRVGWSKTGSAGPLSPYSIEPNFTFSANPWGTTPVAFYPGTLWNPNIKNEDTVEKEFGLEARLFQSRLRLDFTYYDKKTSDVIMAKDIDPSSGNTSYWDNVADITNKGFEFTLGADIIRSEDGFNLGMDINFARNVNEAQNIDDDASTNNGRVVLGGLWNVDIIAQEGEAVGAIYGPAFERSPSGDVIYENGIAQIAATSKVLGNINADFTAGLGLNMSYKNLRLTTLFDVKKGGEIYSQTNSWGKLAGVLSETIQGRETGIVGNGVMSDGNGGYVQNNVVVPAQTFFSSSYSQNIAESSVYDASFVKWRELSLYYTLPKSLIKNTEIDQVSFGLSVRNLAILYRKVPHIDPESAFSSATGQQGLEYAQIPSTRSIGFNLNVKF
ncbi:MAG: SusC/RagA family TonB-linked outer membrane protein, partial [Lacinutrix sp.]|uniref:SusC/RagA family TonB-linked outer membrane protein n=1 Tax=Lacinutrix sp. TaxID=1937692 RepID=UPI0030A6AD7D